MNGSSVFDTPPSSDVKWNWLRPVRNIVKERGAPLGIMWNLTNIISNGAPYFLVKFGTKVL